VSTKNKSEEYSIHVQRDKDGRIEAFELRVLGFDGEARKIWLNGYKAPTVAHSLYELLKGYGVSSREWSSAKQILLDSSDAGPHGELLLRAVKPVRRSDHVAVIASVVSDMSREEALYWCAKCSRPNGLRALRLICYGSRR
jgi:hypothetical protein